MGIFVNKVNSILKKTVSSSCKQKKVAPHSEVSSFSYFDLNASPLNINRPKINHLSSKLLLEGKGKAFIPNDIHFTSDKSVSPDLDATHRFLDSYHVFKTEYNAKNLPVLGECIKKVFFIDNFEKPYGSISITKNFDEPIATAGLYQCAALAIVDKKEKVQTLLHFFPNTLKKYNDELLDYILRYGNSEDLEFTIVPGCYEKTDNTIGVLVDKIIEKRPNANINFKYFPNENGHNVLILKDGQLYTIKESNIIEKIKNPMEDICYAVVPEEIIVKRLEKMCKDGKIDTTL